jgi:D-psicose/D-tagatose/L-ribulose 3-epimerase
VRLGASTFIWTSPFGDDRLHLIDHVAGLGFDTIEICIEDPARISAEAVAAAADATGIGVLVCGAFGPERDVSHEDAAVRAGAAGYIRTCVDIAAAVGSPVVAGPMYAPTGQTRLLSEAERRLQWRRAVATLREVAGYAGERGVQLAIEPLNRFETDLVNTVEQGVALCRDIGVPSAGLLLDTFHMNIEEKSIGDAIRAAGPFVRHFHACENDRAAPGSGHVEWDDVFAALRDIGYDGDVVIESFTPEITEIARAVSLWRPLAESGDALAADGLAFLRESLGRPVGA